MRPVAASTADTRPFAVYVNPACGTSDRCPLVSRRPELERMGIPLFCGGTFAQARHFVGRVVEDAIPGLVVSGGDGTLHLVLNALMESAPPERWPTVALCPAGTTNLLSSRLRVPEPSELMALLADEARPERWRTVEVRTLQVGDRIGLVAGVGFFERASRAFGRGRDRHGLLPLWAALGVLGTVTGLRRAAWFRTDSPVRAWSEHDRSPVEPSAGCGLSGAMFSAEPHIASVWCATSPSPNAGRLYALFAGGEPGAMLRHGLAGLLRLRRSSPYAASRIEDGLWLAAGTRMMIDGEFLTLPEDTLVKPGPSFRVLHPSPPVRTRTPLLGFSVEDRRAERTLGSAG